MSLLSPEFMLLSEEEIRWALAIKGAAAAQDDLNPLTDFEYVQHGLLSKDDVEEAVEHIRCMQYFREEYNINDNPEEGVQLFRKFTEKHRGFLLSVDWDEAQGHFVVVYDYVGRNPDAIDFPEDWRIHLGGFYYLVQAMTSNLHAIREGIVHICECEGMDFRSANKTHHQRGWEHFWMHYPLKHKEISWLRTPLAANLLFSFCKKFMSDDMRKKFQLGCTFYGYEGRIDRIFKQPTPEVARERMIQNIHAFLVTRYHNQQNYRIPDVTPDYDSTEEMADDESDRDDDDEMSGEFGDD